VSIVPLNNSDVVVAQDDENCVDIFPVTMPDEIAGGRDVTISVAAAIGEDQVEIRERWDAQIARFEEQYPNVTVETFIYGFAPDTFAALIATDQVPTLFEVPFTEPGKLISQGIPADLTPLYAQFGLEGLYNDTVLAIMADEEGNTYGLPGFAYALGLAYSLPALEEAGYDAPPATYEELAAASVDVLGVEGPLGPFEAGFGFNMQGGGGGWHFTNIAYGFGADIVAVNEDGTYTATFGEGPAVEAMQYVKDLRWNRDVLPLDLAANPTLLLLEAQAPMSIQGGDSLGWLRLNAAGWAEGAFEDVFDLTNFGFAPMPAGPDGNRYALSGGTARMINSAASEDEQEAAFVFQIWKEFSPCEIVPTREIYHSTQAGQGAPVLPLLAGEFQAAMDEIDADYITMPVENYTVFFDAVANGDLTLVPEPVVAAQDVYVALGEVLSQVLSDENADVAALMAEAADSFQSGVLDPINEAE
jgi:ABC-type glycerol-3-phosphate transport system substrate-binding protein